MASFGRLSIRQLSWLPPFGLRRWAGSGRRGCDERVKKVEGLPCMWAEYDRTSGGSLDDSDRGEHGVS